MANKKFLTLDDIDVSGKRVIVRMDLNVPMISGRVTDNTRVIRLLPTLKELLAKKAKIIIISHLGRPKGRYITDLSLSTLVDTLSLVLPDVNIKFGVDCIGKEAGEPASNLQEGEILLLENLRFHEGEEKNDAEFAKELASIGEIYINDAFSCSHRKHASVLGITEYLPFAAGRLMEEELTNLQNFLESPEHPVTAVVGGAKVSTKLALLENLINKVDNIVIGGAMANTFQLALGLKVGKSLVEKELKETALKIMNLAAEKNCKIHLPIDIMHTNFIPKDNNIYPDSVNSISNFNDIPDDKIAFDMGNETLSNIFNVLANSKTVIWNGPLGVFETMPAATSTIMVAREIARLTLQNKIKSIAGGGDTVAALNIARLGDSFSYLSTAGGAFLEWMEGKELPAVKALENYKLEG
ncbi:MAG: phosphoglycerate kinase [Pseudomonadota bacterium]